MKILFIIWDLTSLPKAVLFLSSQIRHFNTCTSLRILFPASHWCSSNSLFCRFIIPKLCQQTIYTFYLHSFSLPLLSTFLSVTPCLCLTTIFYHWNFLVISGYLCFEVCEWVDIQLGRLSKQHCLFHKIVMLITLHIWKFVTTWACMYRSSV